MNRLDHYVLAKHPGLSRSYAARLIDEGKVLVNGEVSKPGYRIREKDKVAINFDPTELEQIEDIDLPILYEDKDVLVIDKPAGVISHSRGKFWNEPSVASFVRQKPRLSDWKDGQADQEGERAGIVHRLDRVTSGVMVCAKNAEAMSFLQKQFSKRQVKKTYIAIVSGHLEPLEAIIDMPIARNPSRPQTFRADPTGKEARTKYFVEESVGSHDKVRLEPETGRTHQIRVHLHETGHPIVGDHLYGGEEADRLFLHAVSLELKLPSGEHKVFESPLPDNFTKQMESYNGSR